MLAIAMVNVPPVVIVDEGTTGLDPKARREFWKIIERVKKTSCVVLLTHSMFEAESIGDKVAILALGRLRAIGTPTHLKQRYGAGFTVSITCANAASFAKVKRKVAGIAPSALLDHESGQALNYMVPLANVSELQKIVVKKKIIRI